MKYDELQRIVLLLDKIFTKVEKRNKETLTDDFYEKITLTDLKTIYAIGKVEAKTMKLIAEDLGIAPNTATVAVERLVTKNLATRETSHEDRRIQLIKLTSKAIEIMEQMDKELLVYTEHFLSPLSDAEILVFKLLLEKIDTNL